MEAENSKGKKYGISGWMVHNIERFNASTDFEQYACSPPEAEGFFAECPGGLESAEPVHSSNITSVENLFPKSLPDHKNTVEETIKFDLPELKLSSPKIENLQQSLSPPRHAAILDVFKCDEAIYSSPDTTPCSTPQPSPAPQRKISFHALDSVESNPEKWFYLGGMKSKKKLRPLKGKCDDQYSESSSAQRKKSDEKQLNIKYAMKDNSVKLAISNFDLNAISPSSW